LNSVVFEGDKSGRARNNNGKPLKRYCRPREVNSFSGTRTLAVPKTVSFHLRRIARKCKIENVTKRVKSTVENECCRQSITYLWKEIDRVKDGRVLTGSCRVVFRTETIGSGKKNPCHEYGSDRSVGRIECKENAHVVVRRTKTTEKGTLIAVTVLRR